MHRFVFALAVVFIAAGIPTIFGEVELPEIAVECVEDDKKLFKVCEAENNIEGLTDCVEKYEKEYGDAVRDVEFAEKCTELKDSLSPEQLLEYMRLVKLEMTPEQAEFLAEIGY